MDKDSNVQPKDSWSTRLSLALKNGLSQIVARLDEYRLRRERARIELAQVTTELADAEARRLRADALCREAETRANVAETEAWVASRRVEAEEERATIAAEAAAKAELLSREAEEERRTITADAEAQAELHRRETEDAVLKARENVANKKEKWDHRLQWAKNSVAWVKEEVDDYRLRKVERIALAKSHGGTANLNPFASFLAIMSGIALLVLSLIWARAAVNHPTGPWGTLYFACFTGSLLSFFASWRLRKQPFGKALKQTFVNPVTIPAALVGLGLILRAWQ